MVVQICSKRPLCVLSVNLDLKSDYLQGSEALSMERSCATPILHSTPSLWCSGLANLRSALENTGLNLRNLLPETNMTHSRILTFDLYNNLKNMLLHDIDLNNLDHQQDFAVRPGKMLPNCLAGLN